MKKSISCLLVALIVLVAFIASACRTDTPDPTDPHVHSFGEWETVTAPSCTENGLQVRTCTCDEKEQREINATGHIEGDWITNADNSKLHLLCAICGEVLEEKEYSEGLTFALSDDGKSYIVTGIGTCADEDILIPPVYNSFPVTIIGYRAFFGRTSLTSITIPDSVTKIGSSAFSGCSGLTNITIQDGVTEISDFAFQNCTGLTSVTIGSGVTSVGRGAFSGCTGLTSVHITDIAAWLGISFSEESNPLYYAHNLYLNGDKVTDLMIPDGVTSIGSLAFSGCTSLTNITIPDSVTSVGSGAFSGCTGLTSITIPDSVTVIRSSAFSGCTGLTSITIPDSVTVIGNNAFSGCTGLTSVHITDIAAWCGISFASVGEDNDDPNCNPLYYAHNLYLNGKKVTDLVIPDGVTSIGNLAFSGYTSLTSITIPDSVTEIGYFAFLGCTNLTSIHITDISAWLGISFHHAEVSPLFYSYNLYLSGEKVTDLIVPDSVTEIGDYVFYSCTSLTSVTIPDSVTKIGNSAFYDCTSLTSVTIPDSVTKIGNSAFYDCTSLTSILFDGAVPQWQTIGKAYDWDYRTGEYSIYCTDGTIAKNGTVTYH